MTAFVDLMRDKAGSFPDVPAADSVRALRIWHCKYKSLAKVGTFHNLEELVIASFPDDSFAALEGARKLRYLSVLHMPKINNLAPLANLSELETLSLATSPTWDASGKCTVVESLEPLANLHNLKHLELFGVRPQDASLAALERCKSLESVRLSQYPKEEVERFIGVAGVRNAFNPKPSLID
ncbi:hypothetical protein Q3O98_25920 [Ralstonia pseudosolanacearum]|uniref:hypothetical protein n=1 Tax=Ralstonia pseudosolanacearum TaxID=1310165 RepID=UPI002676E223|nr:hypothetical protein [Ralstonia pseudosolanacearum]MDO3624509.1 hypothetical protein [Ralstonia pseudosolanacearum]